jgi:hypothetical protein
VLRGEEGVGKGFLANVIGRLCPHHYVVISQSAHLTGRFNPHHQQCLLMFVDEGFWAGDKQGEGALKHLVTDPELLIEPKHVNPFMVRNLSRLIIASNEHWVVPAGTRARRWFVLDVANTRANDRKYFGAIVDEMENGGLQALMHLLMNFDLSTVDIFAVPKTAALLAQKEESLPPHSKESDGWPKEVRKDQLWKSYRDWAMDHNIRSRLWPVSTLHHWLKPLLPGSQEIRRGDKERTREIVLPELDICREAYAEHLGQPVAWGQI